jgi:hypothetical protein
MTFSFWRCLLLGWTRKRRIININNSVTIKSLYSLNVLCLSKEDFLFLMKELSDFFRNNADNILNASIILSCILLYINIPKVLSILFNDKLEKKELIQK